MHLRDGLGLFCLLLLALGCPNVGGDDDDDASDDDTAGDDDISDDDVGDDDAGDDDASLSCDSHNVPLLVVEAATFTMGAAEEVFHDNSEDEHEVTLTRDFCIGTTELTQTQFEAIVGWNPSFKQGCADCPVEYLNWFEALAFLNELSALEGLTPCYGFSDVECEDGTPVATDALSCMNDTQGGVYDAVAAVVDGATPYDCSGYRLPMEAEWELAARGGLAGASYPNGGHVDIGDADSCDPGLQLDDQSLLEDVSWYCANASEPVEVAGLAANGLGLYDVSGNVFEWCFDGRQHDLVDATDPVGVDDYAQVRRGGSFIKTPFAVRVFSRSGLDDYYREQDLGFRVARTRP